MEDSHKKDTLLEQLEDLKQQGYKHTFKTEGEGLRTYEGEKIYRPEEVKIVSHYRFEGDSNPDDSCVLYVIEAKDGEKGTLTDAYGTYSDPKIEEFMRKVPQHDYGQIES